MGKLEIRNKLFPDYQLEICVKKKQLTTIFSIFICLESLKVKKKTTSPHLVLTKRQKKVAILFTNYLILTSTLCQPDGAEE